MTCPQVVHICVGVVNINDNFDKKVEELLGEVIELRKIAARNLLRAAHIADTNPEDEDVTRLLMGEAAVMLSVAHRIETLLDP